MLDQLGRRTRQSVLSWAIESVFAEQTCTHQKYLRVATGGPFALVQLRCFLTKQTLVAFPIVRKSSIICLFQQIVQCFLCMPLTPFFLVVFAGFLGVLPESLTSLIVLPEGKEVAETEGVEFLFFEDTRLLTRCIKKPQVLLPFQESKDLLLVSICTPKLYVTCFKAGLSLVVFIFSVACCREFTAHLRGKDATTFEELQQRVTNIKHV